MYLIFACELAVLDDVGEKGSWKLSARSSERDADARHDIDVQAVNVDTLGDNKQVRRANHATTAGHHLHIDTDTRTETH